MAAAPYIPRADAAFDTWARNFCTNISDSPTTYMMSPAEAASLMQAFNSWHAAFRTATNPLTRTRGTICDKDDARSILRNLCRMYAGFIKLNRGITDGDKLIVGVPPINPSHHKRVCPSTQPLVSVIGTIPGVDELRYHDASTPSSSAKPFGAERLELWRAFSGPGEPQPKMSEASLVGSFKKSKMLVDQDVQEDARGRKPTYWGRWVGFNGEVGPWSLPMSMAIAREKAAEAREAKSDGEDDQPLRLAA